MTQATNAVNFKHYRNFAWGGWDGMDRQGTLGKGGVTMAYRDLTPEERVANELNDDFPAIFVGFAACSAEDNYDKQKGRELATQRLATSKNIYGGDLIHDLLGTIDLQEVDYIIVDAMAAQGMRTELCLAL